MTTSSLRSAVGLTLFAVLLIALPATADIKNLLEISEKLDRLDKLEFKSAIDKADDCTRVQDFACTESQLKKAAKLARGSSDKKMLSAALQDMAHQKAIIAEEARRRAEEARLIAEEELRQAQEERRLAQEERERAEEESRQAAAEERERVREEQAERRARQEEERAEEASGPSFGSQVAVMLGEKLVEMQAFQREQAAGARQVREIVAAARQRNEEAQAERNREAQRNREMLAEARQARQQAAEDAQIQRRRDSEQARSRREAEQASQRDAREKENARVLKAQQDREKKRQEDQQRANEARELARSQELNRQRIAKEKADKLAAEQAEKAAEAEAKNSYLATLIQGVRLVATKCPDNEGHFYATGNMPTVKRAPVSCIDVHYEASCPDSRATSRGVAKNFIGMSGCFGDTYQIEPKPPCPVKQVQIRVTDVRPCSY